jgi:hypothetical protein
VSRPGRRAAVRDSLGVGIAVGAYGFAFGAASVAAGLSVLASGPLLGSRNAFYAMRLAPVSR